MPYEIKSYKFIDFPTLQQEMIDLIKEQTELLFVVDWDKNDCIMISG